MNRKLFSESPSMQSERMLHAFMTALVAMCMIGCYALRRSIDENVNNITASIEECTSLSFLEPQLASSIEKSKTEIEHLELEYRSTLARIPTKFVDSELLSAVRGVAHASRCTLLNFRPSETNNQLEFQTRSFELQLEGKFRDLYEFFDSLGRIPYVYHVRRFKISEPGGTGGACKIDLELKVAFNHVWSKLDKAL